MSDGKKNYTAKERLKILQELDSSGMGVMEFCRKSGVPYTTLSAWRTKHRRGESLENIGKPGPQDPTQRIQAVEAYLKSGMSMRDFARTYGVSQSTASRWIRLYEERGVKALEGSTLKSDSRKRGPKGISKDLRSEIVEVKRENPQFGLRKVKSFLNRFRGVDASVGTINKTIKEEKLVAPPPRRKRRRSSDRPRRFERAKPMQLWQSDITYFTLTKYQQRCYLTVFLDDYSRYVVGWRLGLRQTGEFVMEALLDGIQRFGRPQEVLTDQGRQYFAWRGKTDFQNLLRKQGIQHVVARSHHPQTVGKCERLWKTIKDEFWDRVGPMDLEEATDRLHHYFNHYNHFRPNQGIDNLVPADRFFGAEKEVRAAIEKALSENEIRLATGERPRPPTFLIGQIGGKAISMHGENGKLVLQMPGEERKEISYESIECEGSRRDNDGIQEEKEKADEDSSEVCAAGENSLGDGKSGAEAKGADCGDSDPRILDGAHYENGGIQETQCTAGESMAAVTAGNIGYAGGTTGTAQDEGERSADEPERRPESTAQEDKRARRDDQAAGSIDQGTEIDAGMPGRDGGDGRGGGE